MEQQWASISTQVLMTKYGKSRKTGLTGLPNWFQSKTEEGAKLEDLKIQGVLEQENGLKGIMRPR
jgi:hypothetical protein